VSRLRPMTTRELAELEAARAEKWLAKAFRQAANRRRWAGNRRRKLEADRAAGRRPERIGRSEAGRRTDAEYERAKAAWWPGVKGTLCPIMLKVFNREVPVCKHPHHVRGRAGKLKADPRWFLACSLEGHRWAERATGADRELAVREGWVAGPGEWGRWDPPAKEGGGPGGAAAGGEIPQKAFDAQPGVGYVGGVLEDDRRPDETISRRPEPERAPTGARAPVRSTSTAGRRHTHESPLQ